MVILSRASVFLPLVNKGSFVAMIRNERSSHTLDPLDNRMDH